MLAGALGICANAASTSSSPRRSSMVPRWSEWIPAATTGNGERRVIALGTAQDIALTVVYTDRAEFGGDINRRIISARKSNRREREAYKKATSAK